MRCYRAASYHLPEQPLPPLCPGFAERTWLGIAQTVADSRLAGWSAVQGHFSSVLGGPGRQSSTGSDLNFDLPAVSLHHSAATPTAGQPADKFLRPARSQYELVFTFIINSRSLLNESGPKSWLESYRQTLSNEVVTQVSQNSEQSCPSECFGTTINLKKLWWYKKYN